MENTQSDQIEYPVSFGTAFSIDGFGFVGKGKIQIADDKVILLGKTRWPFIAQLAIFIVLTVVIPGIGFFIALIVVSLVCVSDGTLTIDKSTISSVKRTGRKIVFKGKDPKSNGNKQGVFQSVSEEQAAAIESNLVNP
ncbi:MAG: hypothetical protein WCO45_12575 [Pseudanabaena sp. ELA607]